MKRGVGSAEGGPGGREVADRKAPLDDAGFRTDAHAVVIGINVYEDGAIPDLRYACADAEAVCSVLTDPELGRFQEGNVKVLLDQRATRKRIVSAIANDLPKRAGDGDTVVVYFAGHGAPVQEQGEPAGDGFEKYLVPHDGEFDNLCATGVDMADIRKYFGYLDARKVIFFVDSCYSGVSGGRTFERQSLRTAGGLSDQFLESLASEGRLVITACGPNEVSMESDDHGRGLFSYYLTEGLKGAADSNEDGIVSIDELYTYVYENVKREARKRAGRMHPVRKGEISGQLLLTQYETESQKTARKLSEQAANAFARREFSAAERLWTGALRADRGCSEARAGIASLLHTRRQRKLLSYFDKEELKAAEFGEAMELLKKEPDTLTGAERTKRRLLLALIDGDFGVDTYRDSLELLVVTPQGDRGPADGEREFVGRVWIRGQRARLRTADGESLLLVPFPSGAPVDEARQLRKGAALFEHLRNREVRITGVREGDRIFSATPSPQPLPEERADPSESELEESLESVFKSDSLKVARKLNALGIHTISAFYHRVKNLASEAETFSIYLGVSVGSIHRFVDSMEAGEAELIAAPPKRPLTRNVGKPGKKRARATVAKLPEDARTTALPAQVDLTRYVTSVRNQGQMRATSVAFAAIAAFEHELIRKAQTAGDDYEGTRYNTTLDLSEQYLYWACKELDKASNEDGTSVRYAAMVLSDGISSSRLAPGVVREPVWRYNPDPIEGNPGQGPPPDEALKAPKLAVERARQLDATSIRELKETLHRGHCVVLSVYTYHFWVDGYAWREGVISLPSRTPIDGADAVCLVGYEDEDDAHGDGQFRFKNSWGTKWGVARPDPGFGDLPYRYVLTEGIEAWAFEV